MAFVAEMRHGDFQDRSRAQHLRSRAQTLNPLAVGVNAVPLYNASSSAKRADSLMAVHSEIIMSTTAAILEKL